MPRTYHPYFQFKADLATLDLDRVTQDDLNVVEDAKQAIIATTKKAAGFGFVGSAIFFRAIRSHYTIAPALLTTAVISFYAADKSFRNQFCHVKQTLPENSYLRHYMNDVMQPYWDYYYKSSWCSLNCDDKKVKSVDA